METNIRQVAVGQEAAPFSGQGVGVIGSAVLVVEDIVQITERRAVSGGIVIVLESGLTEKRHNFVTHGDGAVACLTLGSLFKDFLFSMHTILTDVDLSGGEVYISPFQSADLAAAHTGEQGQHNGEEQGRTGCSHEGPLDVSGVVDSGFGTLQLG